MLDQLRAMGIFACVVRQNSFSGAAKELGITTSAVSQQIRSLEQEMAVTLLYRSTRKISLTEAGKVFFLSCKEMLEAAERGRKGIHALREDLVGPLNIAAGTDLLAQHVIPALSYWMEVHPSLNVQFEVMPSEQQLLSLPDLTLKLKLQHEMPVEGEVALASIEQILVAAPSYLQKHSPISHPTDLQKHALYSDAALLNTQPLLFTHVISTEKISLQIQIPKQQAMNHIAVVKSLCGNGLGVAQVLSLDVQKEVSNGQLNVVLSDWKLPQYTLYAVVADSSSIRTHRCLDVLKAYFDRFLGKTVLKEAS
ncbi:LysR family transcriptional regulator [Acinetobacter sp. MD2(2019)]|uniref:LysR family transcriptional regulator n=1 Tax=Acinetobacter sp. MD2(2019) TaxID=2605273 RepID=UPI002D1E71DF|nr:LysR family transcriptional regulator [Acinetobacter sp. MD2(2019)]MEB3753786.1 LysR family transcriptional regulator [Acinetobacter sp. MD2(2019)]